MRPLAYCRMNQAQLKRTAPHRDISPENARSRERGPRSFKLSGVGAEVGSVLADDSLSSVVESIRIFGSKLERERHVLARRPTSCRLSSSWTKYTRFPHLPRLTSVSTLSNTKLFHREP